MSNKSELTLTFLDRLPSAAARALQELPQTEASAFMDTVPTRIAAPVVAEMIPYNAARLLESITTPRAAMILRQLGFSDTVGLIRLVQTTDRDRVLAELPTKLAARLSAALRYPPHQVGAWIDPEIATLAGNDSVADALRVLSTTQNASHVFVEEPGHGPYIGTITVVDVLRASPDSPLSTLGISKTPAVSNRASITSIAFDERWDTFIFLPVVGRRGNLLGGLSRLSLRESTQGHPGRLHDRQDSLLHHMSIALLDTTTALIDSAVRSRQIDSARPTGARANER
jgi:Mg/Co/Ni transporter MgtE